MKKILFTIAIAMAFIGCDIPESQEYEVNETKNTRFQTVYEQRGYDEIKIILDKETGVKYMYISGGYKYGAGLTKLEENNYENN
jgi:hypothetical protein